MNDSNIIPLNKPESVAPLQAILKKGEKAMVLHNDCLPERTVQTGLGDIEIKIPKTRDRSQRSDNFNSTLIPPYLNLLVIIGSDVQGNKELITLSDGYRESAASWEETLLGPTRVGGRP